VTGESRAQRTCRLSQTLSSSTGCGHRPRGRLGCCTGCRHSKESTVGSDPQEPRKASSCHL
jgi:hypothetical protein